MNKILTDDECPKKTEMSEWVFCTTVIDTDEASAERLDAPLPSELLVLERHRIEDRYRTRPLTEVLDNE